jgi:ssDNA-binding replication factor A large subunit
MTKTTNTIQKAVADEIAAFEAMKAANPLGKVEFTSPEELALFSAAKKNTKNVRLIGKVWSGTPPIRVTTKRLMHAVSDDRARCPGRTYLSWFSVLPSRHF